MNTARIQPCLKNLGFELKCYNGKEICLRTKCRRDEGLRLHYNHFCLIWKSQSISFNQAKGKLKSYNKIVDSFITKKMLILFLNSNSYQRKLNLFWLSLMYMT